MCSGSALAAESSRSSRHFEPSRALPRAPSSTSVTVRNTAGIVRTSSVFIVGVPPKHEPAPAGLRSWLSARRARGVSLAAIERRGVAQHAPKAAGRTGKSRRCGILARMPELPDVTLYVEHLARRLVGKTLETSRVISPNLLRTAE